MANASSTANVVRDCRGRATRGAKARKDVANALDIEHADSSRWVSSIDVRKMVRRALDDIIAERYFALSDSCIDFMLISRLPMAK